MTVLSPPVAGLLLSLYLTVTDKAMGAMLAQIVNKEERVIYYISKKFLDYEVKYTSLEKTCLAQVWATEIKTYMLSYSGRAVADFLADNPIKETEVVDTWSFSDEDVVHVKNDVWNFYFDEASNYMGYGVGIPIISPTGEHVPVSIKLDFNVTNNAAEYEACLLGLRSALDLGVNKLLLHGYSSLVINQVGGSWKVKRQILALYQTKIEELEMNFEDIRYVHLLREENQFADALSKLASLINIPDHMDSMPLCVEQRSSPAYGNAINDTEVGENEPWIDDWQLYKKTVEGVLLRCIDKLTAEKVMEEVHDGECGPYMNAHILLQVCQALSQLSDIRKCTAFGTSMLYTMTSPWPFSTSGIDIIGKVNPSRTGGHCFILVAIDYFTKWVEAKTYKVLNVKHVSKFLQNVIICQYGVPYEFISDHGTYFQAETAVILEKYKIKHHK
ncbi:uncharacterized protein LOC141631663 [Silene latifolia]|uniref:uncharacterized protein LOC141631663 n=1 Tax=Silene latifolia TaxID=37657 RepID=UPI003D777266